MSKAEELLRKISEVQIDEEFQEIKLSDLTQKVSKDVQMTFWRISKNEGEVKFIKKMKTGGVPLLAKDVSRQEKNLKGDANRIQQYLAGMSKKGIKFKLEDFVFLDGVKGAILFTYAFSFNIIPGIINYHILRKLEELLKSHKL